MFSSDSDVGDDEKHRMCEEAQLRSCVKVHEEGEEEEGSRLPSYSFPYYYYFFFWPLWHLFLSLVYKKNKEQKDNGKEKKHETPVKPR